MADILSKICRICLKESINNLRPLDNIETHKLNFIKVELNMALIETPVICNVCRITLQQSFDFKSIVSNNFEYLSTFKNDTKPVINIEEVMVRHIIDEDVKIEVEKVCLLCLKYFDIYNLISLNDSEEELLVNDLLDRCVPEIDFSMVSESFLCNNCVKSLQSYFNFTVLCTDSDNLIKNCTSLNAIDSKKIDLHTVLEHVQKLNENSEVVNIKQEIEALSPCPEIKIEDEDVEEDADLLVSNCNTASNSKKKRSKKTKKIFKCPFCIYKNCVKDNLMSHLLVHEKMPSVKFKCDLCNFHSKWRSSLLTHMLLHKKSTEITIFKCYNCSYETKYKKHLRRHMKQHKFQLHFCTNCNYKTKIKTRLKIHKCKPKVQKRDFIKIVSVKEEANYEENKQTLNKKEEYQPDEIYKYFSRIDELDNWYYLCNNCKYRSHKIDHIKEHVLKHQKQKREKCNICDYKTKYKRTLRKHLKNNHADSNNSC